MFQSLAFLLISNKSHFFLYIYKFNVKNCTFFSSSFGLYILYIVYIVYVYANLAPHPNEVQLRPHAGFMPELHRHTHTHT